MINLLFDTAHAAGETAQAAPNAFTSFIPLIAVFAIFYFLMIRPQKKRLDDEAKLLAALGKGDEVYTKSGILGTITGLTDKVVTVEVSDGVKLKVLRSHIGGLAKKIFETNETSQENKKIAKKEA